MNMYKLGIAGIVVGALISGGWVFYQAPGCLFADTGCPEGATSTFTGNVGVSSGTNYATTLSGASATADRTVTLPDATTSLIGATSTDTLTNKTIDFTLNTGSNYDANNLGGNTLAPAVTDSSLTNVGILNVLDIGSGSTSITEAAAGDINITGNTVYRAGGADVPPTQGGTGTSSITSNSAVIGNGASGVLSVDMSGKGDLLVGNTGGMPDKLAAGTAGQKLTADSTDPKGMTWTTPPPGGGLAVIDGWYYNTAQGSWTWQGYTDLNGTFYQIPSSNGFVGTGSPMTVSNGVFTFPETGMYEVRSNFCIRATQSSAYEGFTIYGTNNNGGSWFHLGKDRRNTEWMSSQGGYGQDNWCFKVVAFFDVVDTTNYKVKFACRCGGMATFGAATNASQFWFTKIAS